MDATHAASGADGAGENVEQRRSGWWVPAGTRRQEIKQPALKDEFDEWIARLVCFAFSTSPTPFVKQQNRGLPNGRIWHYPPTAGSERIGMVHQTMPGFS